MENTQKPQNRFGKFLYWSHLWFLALSIFEVLAILSGAASILDTESPFAKFTLFFRDSFVGQIVGQLSVYLIILVYILLIVLPVWAIVNTVCQVVLLLSHETLEGRFKYWVAFPAIILELGILAILGASLAY